MLPTDDEARASIFDWINWYNVDVVSWSATGTPVDVTIHVLYLVADESTPAWTARSVT